MYAYPNYANGSAGIMDFTVGRIIAANKMLSLKNQEGAGQVISLFTANTERMTVLNNGNVGIGTTAPAYTLDINGTAACTSGLWSASDGRYKKNIRPVDNALLKVQKLQGVTYNWDLEKTKADSLKMDDRTYIGFIAQQVQEVLPQAFQQAKGDKLLRIDYAQITPVLVEAIKRTCQTKRSNAKGDRRIEKEIK